jgi:hypothetical protein
LEVPAVSKEKEAQASPDPKSAVRTYTLAELGPSLPFGVIGSDEQLHKQLECRQWRGKEEREIARIRREGTRRGNAISAMLAFMFTRVGSYDFAAKDPKKCEALLSPMTLVYV